MKTYGNQSKDPAPKGGKQTLGLIFALITAILSGFAIPVNKMFVVDLDPFIFTAIRAMIIGLIFFLLAGAQVKFKFSQFKKTKWSWLLLIGIIGGGIAFALYFTGLSLTTAGRAAFIHKTLPIYTCVFAFLFLKESITRRQTIALLFGLLGVLLIFIGGVNPAQMWADPTTGDLLVLAGTILWGVENTIAKKAMMEKESHLTVSFARMFFGGVFLFGLVLLLGRTDALMALTMQQWTNILISTGFLFGYVLFWYASLKYLPVSRASIILLFAPVISLYLGVWWFGEPVSQLQMLGSSFVMLGVYFVASSRKEQPSGV